MMSYVVVDRGNFENHPIGILTAKSNLHQKPSFLEVSEEKMILVTDFKGFG